VRRKARPNRDNRRTLADDFKILHSICGEDTLGQWGVGIGGINTDTTRFNSGTTNYVIPASHNQFCQESLPYITAATALLTTIATTFYQLLLL
jgi:hypothetical protein